LTIKNVGDALGDATFVCLVGTFTGDSLASNYMVSVNTTWGQYALCNYNVCVSLQHHLVGQEVPDGILNNGGQCDLNSGLGNWYSFVEESKCPPKVAVGTNGCTWQPLSLNKTINVECLIQIGFFNACLEDGGVPFTKATAVFEGAFLSDDPSKGGCPQVNTEFDQSQLFSSSSHVEEFEQIPKKYENDDPVERVLSLHAEIFKSLSEIDLVLS